jgi:endonuclease YncB( thermonuclease family)
MLFIRVVELIKMKKWGLWIIGVCFLIVILAQVFLAGVRYEKLDFVRVVDGDTFVVVNRRDGQEWKVRLWGVDAPDAKKCFYKEAGEVLEREIKGKRLTYERFGYDGYGRILARVYVDGHDLEEILVMEGAAVAYKAEEVHTDLKPDATYVARLKKIEEMAKVKMVGIWSKECVKK